MSSVSVVLPAHNEEGTIGDVVKEVLGVVRDLGCDYEIIVVNDGSTDRTGPIAEALNHDVPHLQVVETFPGGLYGDALKAGFAAATKEWIVFCGSDKQYVFSDVERLLAKTDHADIVSGHRTDRQDHWLRKVCALGWNIVVRCMFGYLCGDIDCGFKVFRREILGRGTLVSRGAAIDLELLAGAKALGYRIAEETVSHLPRTTGVAHGISFTIAVRALVEMARLRARLFLQRRVESRSPRAGK